MPIQVLLADDHRMCRDGFAALIAQQGDMNVVAEASNGLEALEMVGHARPDIVIMDVAMPEMNGIEAAERIALEHPGIRLIALSMHADRQYGARMLEAGARGYLLKNSASRELIEAIRAVSAGRTYITQSLMKVVVDACVQGRFEGRHGEDAPGLSAREEQILRLVTEGLSSRDIASRLEISIRTVDAHRQRVMQKLGIESIAGLTKYAIRQGLTTLQM